MSNLNQIANKKKILFKIWKFPSLSETFITAQIITAINSGYEVSVLVKDLLDFESSKQQELLEKYAIDKKIILEDFKIPKNRIWRFFQILAFLPGFLVDFGRFWAFLSAQDAFSLTHFYRFLFYSSLRDFDIIHVQYGTNAKPFDLLKKTGISKAKLVVSFHGHDAFFPINGWIENNGYYDDLFKYGDVMVANTPYLAQKIEALGCPEKKIESIPVGVDAQFFNGEKSAHVKGGPLRLITVGRLDKVKGHRFAIEVVKILKDKGFKVCLTIVGEGGERKNLKKLIKKSALNSLVTLVGKKSQREIRDYLLSSDLYILAAVPLQNDRRETQGLATLEAQSCGLPAVVFDSGGVSFTIENGESGFLVPEYDTVKMAERCQFFIENTSEIDIMGQNARKFVKGQFDQKVIDTKWSLLYDNLI